MGCLKLHIEENYTPLKLAYSRALEEKNNVQGFLSYDPIAKDYPELTPYQFGSDNPIWNIDLDGLEGVAYDNLGNSQPKKRAGTYNTDWGFATAASAGQANNQGGRITGTKYYNYSLPWTIFYLWQKPVLRVSSNTDVNPNLAPGVSTTNSSSVVMNTGFRAGTANPLPGTIAVINSVAAQAPNSNTTQAIGQPFAGPPEVQTSTNSEGLPVTTEKTTMNQAIQNTVVQSTIIVSMSTDRTDAGAAALLTARFNAISAQLQQQGVPAANIVQGAQQFGVQGLANGNQTTFTINTTTTTSTGTQTATTTTTTDTTYEQTE
ncbi:MAG: hypothetical protein ACT4ON_12030 [Bacteroidota bacterium]